MDFKKLLAEREDKLAGIRKIIEQKGYSKAVAAVEAMADKETDSITKAWLQAVLKYLKRIKARVCKELKERFDRIAEEDEIRAAEEIEREAEIANLWQQLAMEYWSGADVTWKGVVSNALEIVCAQATAPR